MPKINVMLLKLEGFQYATSLDLNMGYYHIHLSKNASNLCTIILPRGNMDTVSTNGSYKLTRYFATENE